MADDYDINAEEEAGSEAAPLPGMQPATPNVNATAVGGQAQQATQQTQQQIEAANQQRLILEQYQSGIQQSAGLANAALAAGMQANKQAAGVANIFREAGADEQTAIVAEANVKANQIRQHAELLSSQMAVDEAAQQKIFQAKQDAKKESQRRFSTMLESMREQAAKSVDPTRFWKSKTTGQRVGITIGAMLFDFGASLTGSSQRAVNVIENAIDRDIQAQREDIAAAGRQIELDRLQYATEDEFEAAKVQELEAKRVLGWENFQRQIQLTTLQTDDQAILQNAKQLAAVASMKIAESINRAEQFGYQARLSSIGTAGQLLAQTQSLRASLLGGTKGPEPWGPALIKPLQGILEGKMKIERMRGLFKDAGWAAVATQFFPGTTAGEYAASRNMMILALNKGMNGGNPSNEDRELLERIIPTNRNWGSTASRVFDQLTKLFEDKERSLYKAAEIGGRPAPRRDIETQPVWETEEGMVE